MRVVLYTRSGSVDCTPDRAREGFIAKQATHRTLRAISRLPLASVTRRLLPGLRPERIVATILGIVLLAAAAMKARQGPLVEIGGIVGGRWLSPLTRTTIAFELALALWLISGVGSRSARIVALACFGLFAGLSASRAAVGETHCGCFGDAPVSPLFAAGIDIAAVAALLSCERRCRRLHYFINASRAKEIE